MLRVKTKEITLKRPLKPNAKKFTPILKK